MKVEIKSVKFYESMSEETNAFTGNLYIDGKKVGICKNDGRGGNTYYKGFSQKDNKIIRDCDNHLKTLPDINIGDENRTFQIHSNLENVIDDLFEKWLKRQDQMKMKRKFKTCIIIGNPTNTMNYKYWNFKKPLNQIPRVRLQNFINTNVKPELSENVQILNDNLQELGITI